MGITLYPTFTKAFGQPTRSTNGCHWWHFVRPTCADLRVALNKASSMDWYALIFDPPAIEGDVVLEVKAHTQAEANALVQRIRRLAAAC